ncbi:Sol1 protein [Saccharomycopsis crataegensis]|uniref:Sol1 protein n=1 Tax=Saccharomycopsis crataegensis TaxID=43959 RepID=A0AAV5QJF4_9ASCO|nr:Sol1 protein [Saccharomycopsis crataegensis]
MTTTVPKIYAFKEFDDVAGAVADHIIAAQNSVLFPNSAIAFSKRESWTTNTFENLPPTVILDSEEIQSTGAIHQTIKDDELTPTNGSTITSSAATPTPVSGKKTKKKKKDKKEQERRFKIAISGGSLIAVLNQGLLKRTDIVWNKWDIFFADERLVPFDDEESNYGLAKRKIFDLIADSPSGQNHGLPTVFPINEALITDPEECADDYEKLLIKKFASKDSVKIPMFDLFLLGCAPDGHIASLFPEKEQLRENLAWVMAVNNAPKGPSDRITLSVPVICHSVRVTFVVEGSTKAPILKTVFERPDKALPSSIVNEGAAGRVCWFVDDDALDDVMVTKKKYKYEVDTYKNK